MLDGKVGENVLVDLDYIWILYTSQLSSSTLIDDVDQVIVGHSVYIKGEEFVLFCLARRRAFTQHPEDSLNKVD